MALTFVTIDSPARKIATYIFGSASASKPPLLCIPGYIRNHSDFLALARNIQHTTNQEQAVILLDLAGRGLSSPLRHFNPYTTISNANDVLAVLRALDIPQAHFLGEGHGGQLLMLIANEHPEKILSASLFDASPVTEPRELVRARTNYKLLAGERSEVAFLQSAKSILKANYPNETETQLLELIYRQYTLHKKHYKPNFDPRLIKQLFKFEYDDILEPQWPLFMALKNTPLLLARTEFSAQLRKEVYAEMLVQMPEAMELYIPGQSSPALLSSQVECDAILNRITQTD